MFNKYRVRLLVDARGELAPSIVSTTLENEAIATRIGPKFERCRQIAPLEGPVAVRDVDADLAALPIVIG